MVPEECPGPEGLVRVEEPARQLGVVVAVRTVCGPGAAGGGGLEEEIGELLRWAKSTYSLESLREDPVVRAYRKFYWRIGVDPTKTRPSSEALLRRALRDKWPRINPVVDSGNIASARSLVPIGLYDMDRIVPPLRLTVSRGGEEFRPIGGGEERLPKGLPILVDAAGKVLHLYPHRDSRDTMIRPETSRILALAAGVPGVGEERLRFALETLARLLARLGWKASPIIIV